jgi:multiple sugar transport system substrate-binding protein
VIEEPGQRRTPKWALEDRLVDLTETVGSFSNLFDPYLLDRNMLLNSQTGKRALYGLPFAQARNQLYVWKSLLEQAGFTLADIPKQWDAFWSFWCDRVQPAVRRVTGREDIWGVGLVMSAEPDETVDQFFQFVVAYEADYVTRDGKLVIDDPEVRPAKLLICLLKAKWVPNWPSERPQRKLGGRE